MSEQVVPSAVAQHIIVKFLTKENMKPAETLTIQWWNAVQNPCAWLELSCWKKAEQRLKTCKDYLNITWTMQDL